MDLPQKPNGSLYDWEGLSGRPDAGMFCAATGDKLFEINMAAATLTEIGDHTPWAHDAVSGRLRQGHRGTLRFFERSVRPCGPTLAFGRPAEFIRRV